MRATPLTVYLPFNRDCLRGGFTPAKRGGAPTEARGHWLIVQEQGLLVVPEGDGFRLPTGARPPALDAASGEPLWLGTWAGTECWVAG
ncbi:MAG: hypothetical protein HY616_05865, partial [Candidatus Rokubacteria bacterium]|nr:hypothetical protein [Candidatus Rokubacteria bacterium]